MSKIAQLNPDGSVAKVFNAQPVSVEQTFTVDRGAFDTKGKWIADLVEETDTIQHGKGIFTGPSQWTDAELNAIGFARFEEERVPSDKRSTGTEDVTTDGRVLRKHTTIDYVPPPPPPDPVPGDEGYDFAVLRRHYIAEELGGGDMNEAIGQQLDVIWKALNVLQMNGTINLPAEADAMVGKLMNIKGRHPDPGV